MKSSGAGASIKVQTVRAIAMLMRGTKTDTIRMFSTGLYLSLSVLQDPSRILDKKALNVHKTAYFSSQ